MEVKGKRFLATRLGDPEGRCAFSGSLDQALTPQTRHLAGHELGDREEAASAWGPQGGLGVPIHEQYNQLSAKGASPPRGSEQPQGPGAWPTHSAQPAAVPSPEPASWRDRAPLGAESPPPPFAKPVSLLGRAGSPVLQPLRPQLAARPGGRWGRREGRRFFSASCPLRSAGGPVPLGTLPSARPLPGVRAAGLERPG